MKLAALQLQGYALHDLSYRSNQDHDPDKDVQYHETDLAISVKSQRDPAAERRWVLELSVRLQPSPAANAPYNVTLQLSGIVQVIPAFDPPNLEELIEVNGASMLFGVARELVRQVTCVGPRGPILLPSVSFRADKEPPAPPK